MRVMVTGAGGQLGKDVVGMLRGQHWDTLALGRNELDLTDTAKLRETLERLQPDWIVNCAAWTAVDAAEKEVSLAYAVNRDAVRDLASCAAALGSRLLHVSTDFVFSGQARAPYREEDETGPLGVYGLSKREGELEVLSHPGNIVLRTSWLYGVHGGNFVKTMLRLAEEREELRVVCDQVGSPTWSRDLAGAMIELLRHQPSGIYHYANRGETSWHGFAEAILDEARELGFPVRARRVVPIPSSEYPTPAVRPAYSVLATEKIETLLSEPVRHWRTALHLMLEELKQCPDC